MKIFTFLALVAITSAESQPNFVVVLTDDQGFDDYGFRQPLLETPTLDKLMSQGVHFTRFYTASACAPTRSALLTGRNFMRTGTSAVGFGGDAPHPDEYMLSEAMKDAGYATGIAGKWNLGTSDAELPSRRGFDEAWTVSKEEVRSYGRYDHFKAPFFYNGGYTGIEDGWMVERVTDKAISFIENHKEDSFFLYVPYSTPHEPWLCRKELQEKYLNMGVSESYAMFLGMMEQLDTQVGRILQALEDNGLSDDTIVLFFGDNGPTPTTRVLQHKEDGFFSLTRESYTLNEEEWAARNPTGLRAQKATGWENAMRNRLSIYCPAKFNSKEVSDMTLVMDIYPTLLDLAGAKRKEEAPPLDGKSLRPLLEGTPKWPNRGYLTGETGQPAQHLADDGWYYRFTKKYSFPLKSRSSCFVLGNWVVVNDFGKWGLYNLRKDPHQRRNKKKKNPEKFAQMKKKYFSELTRVRQDPHAWSAPVQMIGLPGVDRPYLEVEYAYRTKGDNSVTWANTFFNELGATQVLKVQVLNPATYKILVRAFGVPTGTKVQLVARGSSISAMLNAGEKYHDLGQMAFEKGYQTISLTVLECDDLTALPRMEVFSLHLEKVQ